MSATPHVDPAAERAILNSVDPGIRKAVRVLREAGVETFESCQGGEGHCFPEPTVRFHGGQFEGWRGFWAAHAVALPVWQLRRVWDINDGEPVGPYWDIVFRRQVPEDPS